MINSRWPRPMGIMASTALMPVCSGSFTGLAVITPGALRVPGAAEQLAADGALAVDGLAEGVHHAADHLLTHLDGGDAAGPLHGVALFDAHAGAQEHGADVVLLEVEHDALQAAGELRSAHRLHAVEAIDAGDAVTHLEDGTDLPVRPRSSRRAPA